MEMPTHQRDHLCRSLLNNVCPVRLARVEERKSASPAQTLSLCMCCAQMMNDAFLRLSRGSVCAYIYVRRDSMLQLCDFESARLRCLVLGKKLGIHYGDFARRRSALHSCVLSAVARKREMGITTLMQVMIVRRSLIVY